VLFFVFELGVFDVRLLKGVGQAIETKRIAGGTQVDALFDANEIAVSIFMRNEPSGFVGRRTPSLTPRAQIIGTPQQRYVRTSPLHTLSTYCARFSGSLNPCASGSIREVMRATARGPLERTISTATLTMGMVMTQMSVGMLATYV